MHTHNLPLLAVLWLPMTLTVLARLTRFAERRGWPLAARLRTGWRSANQADRAALVLMAVTAAVHVALIPDHGADRVTAVLFAVDCLSLLTVILLALLGSPLWRPAAGALLLGAVGAYCIYIAQGRELIDLTGVATKFVELAAVELIVLSRIIGYRACGSTSSRLTWTSSRGRRAATSSSASSPSSTPPARRTSSGRSPI